MVKINYYGHSAFLISYNEKPILLVDPFLSENPWKKASPEDIQCEYILVTHGHDDHLGDAISIAKRNDATIISTAEVAAHCAELGAKSHAMHIGGKIEFPFGWVRVTQAFHGSGLPGGHACGFIVEFHGKTIYYAGDTGIFGDMKLLGEIESIDWSLLPIGNTYTMGPEDAALAASLLKTKNVIPIHYSTWPVIDQDPEQFKKLVEEKYQIPVTVVPPGTTLEI